MPFDPDDPRLTAFALGELDGDESAEVEVYLTQSDEARRLVDEVRATALLLAGSLSAEHAPGLSSRHHQAIEGELAPSVLPLPHLRVSRRGRWAGYGVAASLLAGFGLSAAWMIWPTTQERVALAMASRRDPAGEAKDSRLPVIVNERTDLESAVAALSAERKTTGLSMATRSRPTTALDDNAGVAAAASPRDGLAVPAPAPTSTGLPAIARADRAAGFTPEEARRMAAGTMSSSPIGDSGATYRSKMKSSVGRGAAPSAPGRSLAEAEGVTPPSAARSSADFSRMAARVDPSARGRGLGGSGGMQAMGGQAGGAGGQGGRNGQKDQARGPSDGIEYGTGFASLAKTERGAMERQLRSGQMDPNATAPPARSRFADPYDADRPPAPPAVSGPAEATKTAAPNQAANARQDLPRQLDTGRPGNAPAQDLKRSEKDANLAVMREDLAPQNRFYRELGPASKSDESQPGKPGDAKGGNLQGGMAGDPQSRQALSKPGDSYPYGMPGNQPGSKPGDNPKPGGASATKPVELAYTRAGDPQVGQPNGKPGDPQGGKPSDPKNGQVGKTADQAAKRVEPEQLALAAGSPAAEAPAAPAPAEAQGNEEFAKLADNPFESAAVAPLSTFSIDVDTASYSILRRHLMQDNVLPPPDAVRIEEMVNYFPYAYPAPTTTAPDAPPFSVNVEIARCPWNAEHRLARIGLKGKVEERKSPSNLVFLIDVSGSMDQANKLPLVQASMRMLAEQLGENDRVSIVVYAGAAGLVLDSVGGYDKPRIAEAIDRLKAGGSTAGGAGIDLAYKVAAKNFIHGAVNRVILATDGDFNVGVSNDEALKALAAEKARTGVFLSVLAFGTGNLKDAKMEGIADKGNGNYAYIDSLLEARKVLVEQMGGTLVTIAKDVKIQVDFNPAKIGSYRLIGYENRMLAAQDFADDTKDAGEIGAGHTVTALYELTPAGRDLAAAPKELESKYAKKAKAVAGDPNTDEVFTVKLRYKAPEGDVSKLIEKPVTDPGADFSKASEDFKFASSVASFGMILRGSPYRGTSSLDGLLEWAESSKGKDQGKYRAEFCEIVRKARDLSGMRAK